MEGDAKSGCCRKCCKPAIAVVVLFFLGITFVLCGIFMPGVFDKLIKEKVKEAVILKKGSLGFKEWKKPSSPVYLQFFMFNLTNPAEVLQGKKPHLHQIGPYSYREERQNIVEKWNSNNTLKYNQIKTYFFDPKTSCSGCDDLSDNITTVNVVTMTLLEFLKQIDNDFLWWKETLNDVMKKNGDALFLTKPVRSLLWGYYDPFLDEIKKLIPASLHIKIEPFVRYQVNNSGVDSNDSISSVFTGEGDIDKLNVYDLWRGQRKMTWWRTNYTNMINGTDGTHFKPWINKDDKLYVFVDQICRSLYLKYHSTITVRDIKLYRFAVPGRVYLSGDIDPNNKGFCTGKCLKTGLLNITACQPTKAPIIVSPPHFYQSNASLLNTTKGLSMPEENEHATFIDVEPITGTTLQANKRIQINVLVEKVKHFSLAANVTRVVLPVFYLNESALVSEADAKEFIHQVYLPMEITKYTPYGLFGLGGLLLLISLIVLIVMIVKQKSDKALVFEGDKEKLIQGSNVRGVVMEFDAGTPSAEGMI